MNNKKVAMLRNEKMFFRSCVDLIRPVQNVKLVGLSDRRDGINSTKEKVTVYRLDHLPKLHGWNKYFIAAGFV